MSTILGISALDKDATAALVVNGQLVKIVMEERLTRRKHQPGFPTRSLQTAFEETGIRPADVDLVTYPFFHWAGEARSKA